MTTFFLRLIHVFFVALCCVLACSLPGQEAARQAPAPAAQNKAASVPGSKEVEAAEDALLLNTGLKIGHPFGDHFLPAGVVQGGDIVSLWGVTSVDGDLAGKAVSLFGNTLVKGRTRNDAVALFGNLEVKGQIGHRAVVLFGDLTLGEKAVVEGDVIVVFGHLKHHPKAVVRGRLNESLSYETVPQLSDLGTWVNKCLRLGRLLGFGEGLGWAWLVAGLHLVFYVLLSLLFRGGLLTCAETFERRPGHSIISGLIVLILSPLLFLLLALTGVGVFVIPLLLIALLLAGWFGRAAIHAWLGRRVMRVFGGDSGVHPAFSVLLGGVIISLLSCVPVFGLWLYGLLGLFGLGAVLYTLFRALKKEAPAADSVSPAMSAVPQAAPLVPDHELPRAGFGRRLGALCLDFALCVILTWLVDVLMSAMPIPSFHPRPGLQGFVLFSAIYAGLMWKLYGATLGGRVFSLKVVRVDGAPLDWLTILMRVLGCFPSFAVLGLGFVWIAFDANKQSWHDKMADTVVVRAQ
jgi:uncharacterized RDD family membrane protein YckC